MCSIPGCIRYPLSYASAAPGRGTVIARTSEMLCDGTGLFILNLVVGRTRGAVATWSWIVPVPYEDRSDAAVANPRPGPGRPGTIDLACSIAVRERHASAK